MTRMQKSEVCRMRLLVPVSDIVQDTVEPRQITPAIEVRRIMFDEALADPDFELLVEEYAEESAIKGMPRPKFQADLYRKLESLGMFFGIVAYKGEKMIGFVSVLANVVPHYGVKMASAESFFVTAKHRKGGPGLAMLRMAESVAQSMGAVGFLVSAPFGGRLADVMARSHYQETHRVFFKRLET